MSPALAAVRCARRTCATPPTWHVVGRCLTCREELPQNLCREHRDEVTTAMFRFHVLSHCHLALVSLVRIEPLP